MSNFDMSNIDGQALEDRLEERLRAGRTPYEAAGEVRFLEDVRLRQGAVSRDAYSDLVRAVDAWLAERGTSSSDPLLATTYAHFLSERVPSESQNPATAKIDDAWREWRRDEGRTP